MVKGWTSETSYNMLSFVRLLQKWTWTVGKEGARVLDQIVLELSQVQFVTTVALSET